MDIHELPRRGYSSLTVHRDRGVLWVCDISSSSSFINSDDLAEHIEVFLPRLHWVSSLAIQAIHGELIQWTGDGFIAWFPLRSSGSWDEPATGSWRRSGTSPPSSTSPSSASPPAVPHPTRADPRAGRARDAHHHQDGHVSKIISGRNVVLAFRIAGVEADFPTWRRSRRSSRPSPTEPRT